MEIKADLSAFNRALQAVAKHSKKPAAEIVNKAAKDVAYRAAQFTPKATRADVQADIGARSSKIYAIASLRLNRTKGKGRWTEADRARMVEQIKKRSLQGIGALRAGWAPAIIKLGGNFRSGKSLIGGRSALRGTAKKATESNLMAMIRNAAVTVDRSGRAYSADEIALARNALARAVQFVTDDRNEYARRKMEEVLKRHSEK